jgi:hypothetical protein
MLKTGMSSVQIEKLSPSDTVDWMRELCWQIAKLRENLDQSRPRITPMGDRINKQP